jgi:hypothetical protein
MARYPRGGAFILAPVIKQIQAATDWRGLVGSYARVAASLEESDSPTLGFLETGLTELREVEGLERLTARLRDNPAVELRAITTELRAAGELLKEFPESRLEFPPRGYGADVIVRRKGSSDVFVEVKMIADIEVFSVALDYLGACSLLDPRFVAFFGLSGAELQDSGFKGKSDEVDRAMRGWIDVLDRKLIAGLNQKFSAKAEGLPEYPFRKLEVKYDWGRFFLAAGGVARIMTGDERRGVARELARLDHLARFVGAVSKAYRQLARCRGGSPDPSDQIRVYQCIPSNLLGLLEGHETKNVMDQVRRIVDAWGMSDLVEVHLSPN